MSYNLLLPVPVVVNGNMASSIASTIVEVKNQDNIGIQLHWTGAPVGDFYFQISSNYAQDIEGNVTNPGNWVVLPVSPAIVASGTPDDAYVDLNQLSAMYVQVVYTAASGSGTLNAIITAKGV